MRVLYFFLLTHTGEVILFNLKNDNLQDQLVPRLDNSMSLNDENMSKKLSLKN